MFTNPFTISRDQEDLELNLQFVLGLETYIFNGILKTTGLNGYRQRLFGRVWLVLKEFFKHSFFA